MSDIVVAMLDSKLTRDQVLDLDQQLPNIVAQIGAIYGVKTRYKSVLLANNLSQAQRQKDLNESISLWWECSIGIFTKLRIIVDAFPSPKAITFYHPKKWNWVQIAENAIEYEKFVAAARLLANAVGGSKIIMLPSDDYGFGEIISNADDGTSFDDLCSQLEVQFGPATSYDCLLRNFSSESVLRTALATSEYVGERKELSELLKMHDDHRSYPFLRPLGYLASAVSCPAKSS
jgi:hypothetical protein